MKTAILSILILALFSVVSLDKAQENQQVVQKCGIDQTFNPLPAFWVNTPSSNTAVADVQQRGIRLEVPLIQSAEASPSLPFSTVVLYEGSVLVSLIAPRLSGSDDQPMVHTRHLAFSSIDPRFDPITLPPHPEGLYWWLLIPETEPGRFGIFGWNPAISAFILSVTLDETGFTLGEPRYLPFDFHPVGRYYPSISDDGNFLAITRFISGESGYDYLIYSVQEERFIWQAPWDFESIPPLAIWASPMQSHVALVSNLSRETEGQLLRIYANGATEAALDLNAYLGTSSKVLQGVELANGTLLLRVQMDDGVTESQVFLFDPIEKTLSNLCLPNSFSQILLSDDERFALFRLSSEDGIQLRLLELATGHYMNVGGDDSSMIPLGDRLFIKRRKLSLQTINGLTLFDI